MQIPFNLKGVEGRVVVTYEANSQPETIGCRPEALGFPMCTATVQYPMRGYDSLMGWVQLVRSDDNASRGEQFEIDPLAPLGDLPRPVLERPGVDPQRRGSALDEDGDMVHRGF